MHKKKTNFKNKERRDNIMSVLTKPMNMAFRVSEEKSKEFLSTKRDSKMLIKKLERLQKAELRSGKSKSHQDVVSLSKKIEELKKEL